MILQIGLSAEPFQTQVAFKLWFDAALVPLMLGQMKLSFVLFLTLGTLKLSFVYNKNSLSQKENSRKTLTILVLLRFCT